MLLTYFLSKIYIKHTFHSNSPDFFPYIAHHIAADRLSALRCKHRGKKLTASEYSLYTLLLDGKYKIKKRKKERFRLRFSQPLVPQFMNPTLMLR